jgi:hypothetical protein
LGETSLHTIINLFVCVDKKKLRYLCINLNNDVFSPKVTVHQIQ